jgi:hypothetical protein
MMVCSSSYVTNGYPVLRKLLDTLPFPATAPKPKLVGPDLYAQRDFRSTLDEALAGKDPQVLQHLASMASHLSLSVCVCLSLSVCVCVSLSRSLSLSLLPPRSASQHLARPVTPQPHSTTSLCNTVDPGGNHLTSLCNTGEFGSKSGTTLDAWSWHTYDYETPMLGMTDHQDLNPNPLMARLWSTRHLDFALRLQGNVSNISRHFANGADVWLSEGNSICHQGVNGAVR